MPVISDCLRTVAVISLSPITPRRGGVFDGGRMPEPGRESFEMGLIYP
jgi:hypothetical protein